MEEGEEVAVDLVLEERDSPKDFLFFVWCQQLGYVVDGFRD